MKHILSFGGGVNSTALYFVISAQNMPLDEIVFADTGDELPETYAIIEKFKQILLVNGIIFTTVKSHLANSLYDYCFSKKIVPSRMKRDCTSKFKVAPIRKYLREKYGKEEKFIMYIGIAFEESHRIRTSDVNYIENQYPLVDCRIDRNACVAILKNNNF